MAKVASRSVSRKVDAATLRRRREIAQELGLYEENDPGETAGEAKHQLTKEKRSDYEKYNRKGRRVRPPPGHRTNKAGMIVPDNLPRIDGVDADERWETPTPNDLRMMLDLRDLLEMAKPFDPEDPYLDWSEEDLERVRKHKGKTPKGYLGMVRAAHRASHPPPQWQEDLRTMVRYTLRYKQAKKEPPSHFEGVRARKSDPPRFATGLVHLRTGAGIVKRLRERFHDLPEMVTGAEIDTILKTSTVAARGGGTRKNVDLALDELIARAGRLKR